MEQRPRVVDATGCSLREDDPSLQQNFYPVVAVAMYFAADLPSYLDCPTPPKIDWERDYAALVQINHGSSRAAVRTVFDNGEVLTFVITVPDRDADKGFESSGKDPFALTVIPRDRRTSYVGCK